MEIRNIDTGIFNMRYFSFGHGEEVFVILPGLSTESVMKSADLVAKQYDDMADDATIYLFDRREDLPDGEYSIQDMADDSYDAMKKIGLHDITLFGASQGGMIAEAMAIRHPDMVKKLILGSTAAYANERANDVIGRWIEMAEQRKREELYLDFGEKLYPQNVFDGLRETLISMSAGVTDEELDRFIKQSEAIRAFDVSDEIGKIKCPVLVIGSEDDAVFGPEPSKEIADLLKGNKGLKLHMYDGYGHAAFDTAPDYRKIILEFMKG